MNVEWDLYEAGPLDAKHTVLLLPGGMCSARSYAEVMAEPALAGTRLVAAGVPAPKPCALNGNRPVARASNLISDGVPGLRGSSIS